MAAITAGILLVAMTLLHRPPAPGSRQARP
jgi:hypothetical protein